MDKSFKDEIQGIVGCTPIPTYPVMGNPYISTKNSGYLWIIIPKNPYREHNKYHGYTVKGTSNCPLIDAATKNSPKFYEFTLWNLELCEEAIGSRQQQKKSGGKRNFLWYSFSNASNAASIHLSCHSCKP